MLDQQPLTHYIGSSIQMMPFEHARFIKLVY